MNEKYSDNLKLARKIVGNSFYFYELPPSEPRMFYFLNKKTAEEVTKTGKEMMQKLENNEN